MDFNKKIENLDIENMPISEIIDIINKTHKLFVAHKVKELKINLFDVPLITELKKKDKVNLDEIVNENNFSIEESISKIKYLENENLVEMKMSSENNQVLTVSLTEKGKKTADKINSIEKEWEEFLFEGVKSSQKDEFSGIAKDLVKNSVSVIVKEKLSFNKEKLRDFVSNNPFHINMDKYKEFGNLFDLRANGSHLHSALRRRFYKSNKDFKDLRFF
ncbi:MarR family winged helix-turn-helix transcriptional regulator [Methanobrevibacter curvatus]|uniref:HTH marR-type domain-containing protein n=1 Tax=Methanobrevibacter curvatus TaxID=49547 RepID=A0A166E417_9EURY|nr:MarR family winged helix-turn-helix transcriptional regulator [Methanobrevibacter curvatus]KZX16256.1 hypothetical protein MBCUR_01030 [Methanobrevibacter curvatus]